MPPCGGEAVMVVIGNIFSAGIKRGHRSAGLWLGAALAIVVAGASLAEVIGGGPPLQAAFAPPVALSPTAAPVAIVGETAEAQPAVAEDVRPRPGAEEQRRIFMLLLLNSAGSLRPYGRLSR